MLNEDNEPSLTINDVREKSKAAISIQQLPKILYALNNMARRSRRQLEKKGVFLGSVCPTIDNPNNSGEQKGILKNKSIPNSSLLSACNEFWKLFMHSFSHEGFYKSGRDPSEPCRVLPRESISCLTRNCSKNLEFISWTHSKGRFSVTNQSHQRRELFHSQTKLLFDEFPDNLLCVDNLQDILLAYIKGEGLALHLDEIIAQIQYLKILLNIPIHKLMRPKPKEFVLPLPRRTSRAGFMHTRSLVAFQTVRKLPPDSNSKTVLFHPNTRYAFNMRFRPLQMSCRRRQFYSTTVPKGLAFLTYPDETDELSFEGTIGGRNLICWKKGTKFPQMGVDQTPEFKSKKEMGKQQMIQSRMQGAKNKRLQNNNQSLRKSESNSNMLNDSLNSPPKKFLPSKVYKRSSPNVRLTPRNRGMYSWLKFKSSQRNVDENRAGRRARCTSLEEFLQRFPSDDRKEAEKAERKKRLKMRLVRVIGYLTCGILPYIIKGECIFKRKTRISSVNAREMSFVPVQMQLSVSGLNK